jgi:hypothetical protein
LRAFVLWSETTSKRFQNNGKEKQTINPKYNVTKAYKRLQSYQNWMDQNITKPGLDVHAQSFSLQEMHHLFQIQLARDQNGGLVLYCDSDAWDKQAFYRHTGAEDMMKYLVWLSHFMMFDKGCQQHGISLIYSLSGVTITDSLTSQMVPIDLQQKIDRLTLGTLPVRVKTILLFNNPTWIRVLITIFSPFLSKKMKERITMISQTANVQSVVEQHVGGANFIPKGFAGFRDCTVTKDLVQELFEKF